MYKNQIIHSMFDPDSYGKPLPEPEPQPENEKYKPVLPELDLSDDPILPPRPDGVTPKPDSRIDPVVGAIGKNLSSILLDTKMTTLSAIKILDYHAMPWQDSRRSGFRSLMWRKSVRLWRANTRA